MGALLDGYRPDRAWDEMYAAVDEPRSHYRLLHHVLGTLSREDFELRCAAREDAEEWAVVEAGVRQRVLALERFLGDVYGPGEILADGVVPRRLVESSSHFHRCVAGVDPAGGVRVHVAGVDLVRDAAGCFRVLEDNLRTPSGISYVIENRRAMTHVFPELFASHRIRRVADYPQRLLEAFRATAPPGVDDSCVVVLTPGIHTSAYFEHSFLARQMGVELVEGRDLVYRRVDDDYLDPLHFRPESVLGCAGILNAARAGNVTIANAPGNGVAEAKAVYPYVPAMIEYYLGEVPILTNVETYRLEDTEVCEWALERLDALVFKPVDGSGGKGIVIGPAASDETLADLRTKVLADPRGWIAQEPVALSTAPTFVDGRMGARHLDLRPFAVNDGRDVWVVPGGLTRVALPEASLIVNSSQGGGSKDTWVLAAADHGRESSPAPVTVRPPSGLRPRRRGGRCPSRTRSSNERAPDRRSGGCAVLSRIAESLYWIGRYVERAEDTARLLDVHYHLLLEDRRADEASVCRALLDAMGADPAAVGDEPDAATVTALLAQDLTFSGSITCSVAAAWENARGAREALSSELWETLNTMYREVGPRARLGSGPARHEFFGWVRDRAAACNGIVDATMSRDDGWRFFSVGRSLERADMTTRLLCARYGDAFGADGLDHDVAHVLRVRGVSPGVQTRSRRVERGGVPAARPALPAVGVPRAHDRGELPR